MPEIKEPPTLVPFGPFEADFRSQELRKQGVRLRLPRQSFQILTMLLVRPGEVVTREELRAKLWPADTFVDFDHGLNAAVKRLRGALGDTAENPRYIETLPRLGYRFIAPRVPDTIQPQKRQLPPRRWGLPLIAATALMSAVVLLALDAGGLRSKLLSSTAGRPQIRSLAVLPLADMSSDPQQEYFADGMTEELITELSRIGSIKVISRTSVMRYKGEKKKSLSQIARELNVDAIMEGSVLRSGNRVRIVAHMIYAPTDQSLMAETYEGDLADVLKMQREVAESITAKVRVKLTPEEESRLRDAPKVDPQAYQAYLAATHEDPSTYQGIKRAQDYLEKAIEKDPNFASAYSSLAASYVLLGNDRWQSPRESFPSAKQAIHKALELDEKNCEAHALLAEVNWRYDWDWQTAEKEILYALELCPNDTGLHWTYALHMAMNGRFAEARAQLAKGRDLDPIQSEPFVGEAVINYHHRNYKGLIETDRASLAQGANDWLAHYWLGVGYEGSGEPSQAIPEYRKAVELSHGDSDATAALAHAYAATSRKAAAQKILQEWLRQSETSYISPYMIATIYAGLGGKDNAFEYLERAYKERSPDLPYFLRADLRMDSLRSDPRFQDLMRRMNFPK
jgi:TolB-like protein/DNA-binding winged helix-turn-helix (wHTH) protein/Tfp pilus assembly protein PilF